MALGALAPMSVPFIHYPTTGGASFPSVARPLLGFFLLRVDRLIGIVAEVWPARDCGDVPKAWNQSDWQKN